MKKFKMDDIILKQLYKEYEKRNNDLVVAYFFLLLDAIPFLDGGVDYRSVFTIPPTTLFYSEKLKGYKKYHQLIHSTIEDMVKNTLVESTCLDFGCGNGRRITQLKKLGALEVDGTYHSDPVTWHPKGIEDKLFVKFQKQGCIMLDYQKDPSFSGLRKGYNLVISHRVFEIPIVTISNKSFIDCLWAILKLNVGGLSVHSTSPNPLEIVPEYLQDEDYCPWPHLQESRTQWLKQQWEDYTSRHKGSGIVTYFNDHFRIVDYVNHVRDKDQNRMKIVRQHNGSTDVLNYGPENFGSGEGYIIIKRVA